MANTPGLNVTSGTIYTLQNEHPANGQKPHFAEKHGALHLVKLSKEGGFQGNLGPKAQFVTDIRSPQNELTLYGHKITLPKLEPASGAETPNARLIVSFETSEDKKSVKVKIKLDNGGMRQKWDLNLNKDSGDIVLSSDQQQAPKQLSVDGLKYVDSGSAEDYFYLKAQRGTATKAKQEDGSSVNMGFSNRVKQTTTANGFTSSKNLSLDTMHFRQDVDNLKEIVSTYLSKLPKADGKPNEKALKYVIQALDNEVDSAVEAHNKGEADDKQKVIVALAKLKQLKKDALNQVIATETKEKSSPQFLETTGRLAYILGKGDELDNMQVLAESITSDDVSKFITGPLDRALVNTQLSLPIIAEATLPEEMFIAKQLAVGEASNSERSEAIKDNMDSALETLLKPNVSDDKVALKAEKDIYTACSFEKVLSDVISDCGEKLGRSDQSEAQSKEILKQALEERVKLIPEEHPDHGFKDAILRTGDRVIDAIVPKLAGLLTKAESTSKEVGFAEGVAQPEQPQAPPKPQNQDEPPGKPAAQPKSPKSGPEFSPAPAQQPAPKPAQDEKSARKSDPSTWRENVIYTDLQSLQDAPISLMNERPRDFDPSALSGKYQRVPISGGMNLCWMRSAWSLVLESYSKSDEDKQEFIDLVKDLDITPNKEHARALIDLMYGYSKDDGVPVTGRRLGAPGKEDSVEKAALALTRSIFQERDILTKMTNGMGGVAPASYDTILQAAEGKATKKGGLAESGGIPGEEDMVRHIAGHFKLPVTVTSNQMHHGVRQIGTTHYSVLGSGKESEGHRGKLCDLRDPGIFDKFVARTPIMVKHGSGHFEISRNPAAVASLEQQQEDATIFHMAMGAVERANEALSDLEGKVRFMQRMSNSWDNIKNDQVVKKNGLTKEKLDDTLSKHKEAFVDMSDRVTRLENLADELDKLSPQGELKQYYKAEFDTKKAEAIVQIGRQLGGLPGLRFEDRDNNKFVLR